MFKLSVGVDGDADVLEGVLGAADDFDRHGIEDFVADDDAVEGFRQFGQVYDFCASCGGVCSTMNWRWRSASSGESSMM